MTNSFLEFIKPTKFKIIFALLVTIIELGLSGGCFIMVKLGSSPKTNTICNKLAYLIYEPFRLFLDRIGDFNWILGLPVTLILFFIIFYIIAIILEYPFIYKRIKN